MRLRLITNGDADLLLRWRQDDERQAREQGWYPGEVTTPAQHYEWFGKRMSSAKIMVCEDADGTPVGMIRLDSNGELSFHAEDGFTDRVIAGAKTLVRFYGGRIKATLDVGDPKAEALEAAGFEELPVRFYRYRP